MTMWSAFVLIALIFAIGGAVSSRNRASLGIRKDWLGNEFGPDDTHSALPARDEELRREVEELRERVKVLERIVTDANSGPEREARRVADEIESLRGK